MATTTETSYGTVNGMPVTLQSTAGTEVDDTLEFSLSVSTNGLTQDINVATVIDISGSAGNSSGSDIDGDGTIDSVLDAEISAAKALFQSLLDAGYQADEVEVTLIVYNGSAATLGTFTMDDQAAHDAALDALSTGGQTNYGTALDEVISAWDATNADADPNNDVTGTDSNFVVFMSDGYSNGDTVFSDEMAILEGTYNAQVSAIGVGASSDLTQLNEIDNTEGAVKVTDVNQLTDAITTPPPPISELVEVEVFIDGVSYGTYTPGDGVLISTPMGYTISNEVLTGYTYSPGETLNFDTVATFSGGETLGTTHSVLMPFLVCFAAGTLIRTPMGERPIETLTTGDIVSLYDGAAAPLRWIGKRTVSPRMMARQPKLRPVRIKAGAFGPGCPMRDLLLSRQHRVLVDDRCVPMLLDIDDSVLVPAHALENGRSIRTVRLDHDLTYYHLALDQHDMVIADGLACETLHVRVKNVALLAEEARQELSEVFPALRDAIARRDLNYELSDPAKPLLPAREGRLLAPFLARAHRDRAAQGAKATRPGSKGPAAQITV